MREQHPVRRQPLEVRRAHVVRLQHVHGTRARHAHHVGEARQRDGHRRQDEIRERRHEARIRGDRRLGVEPSELDREDGDQDEAADELRQADEGERADRDEVVDPGVLAQGCDQSQKDAERHVEGERRGGQHQAVAQPLEDHRPHLCVHARRVPPVAAHVAAQPVHVLHGRRPVEAELVSQLGLRLLGGVPAEDHGGHVAGEHRRRPEDDDRGERHRQQHETETPEDELEHQATSPSSGSSLSAPSRSPASSPNTSVCAWSRASSSSGMWQ